jgi:hypothetical protein
VGVEERLLAVTPRVWLPPNPEVAVVHELRHVRVWRREGLCRVYGEKKAK